MGAKVGEVGGESEKMSERALLEVVGARGEEGDGGVDGGVRSMLADGFDDVVRCKVIQWFYGKS